MHRFIVFSFLEAAALALAFNTKICLTNSFILQIPLYAINVITVDVIIQSMSVQNYSLMNILFIQLRGSQPFA